MNNSSNIEWFPLGVTHTFKGCVEGDWYRISVTTSPDGHTSYTVHDWERWCPKKHEVSATLKRWVLDRFTTTTTGESQ